MRRLSNILLSLVLAAILVWIGVIQASNQEFTWPWDREDSNVPHGKGHLAAFESMTREEYIEYLESSIKHNNLERDRRIQAVRDAPVWP